MTASIPDLVSLAMKSSEDQLAKAMLILQGKAPTPVAPVEPLLTAVDVARQLNISRATCYRWNFPSHEMGGKPRMRMSEILKYLDSEEFKLHSEKLRRERAEKRKGAK
jgi:hypothetical protein